MGGVAWGGLSAVALGLNGILIAIATRRMGRLTTTAVTIFVAFVLLIGYALAVGGDWELRWRDVALLAFLAAAAATAILGSYRSLELGPLAVVSPVSAANGAFTVLFAFALIGERPSALQWLGIVLAAAGAVLASVRFDGGTRIALIGPGPLFAAAGVIAGAISNAGLRIPIRQIGAVQAIIGQRAFTMPTFGSSCWRLSQ